MSHSSILLQLCKAILCHYREQSINNQKWSVSDNMDALFPEITMILRGQNVTFVRNFIRNLKNDLFYNKI